MYFKYFPCQNVKLLQNLTMIKHYLKLPNPYYYLTINKCGLAPIWQYRYNNKIFVFSLQIYFNCVPLPTYLIQPKPKIS